MIQSFVE